LAYGEDAIAYCSMGEPKKKNVKSAISKIKSQTKMS
jgi:hypothetical protein